MTTRDEMTSADFDEILAVMARNDVLRLIDTAVVNLNESKPVEVTSPDELESVILAPSEVLRLVSRAARSLLGGKAT